MNPEKTGSFISELRKSKNLTQQQLADKIVVTRKAVSRWETGKGYPDIEILPELSKNLSVSINELLSGEKVPKEKIAVTSDLSLMYVCQNAAKKSLKNRKYIILLVIGMAVLFAVSAFFISASFYSFLKSCMGSDNCVIAADYSYITYYDEKYVPIDTNGYSCRIGEMIVKEAKVEDAYISTKLFFGDSVYAVNGVSDNSLIYLQTDYDFPPSEYYVKENKLENMKNIISSFEDTYICAVITQEDSKEKEILLENEYLLIAENFKALSLDINEDCTYDRSKGQEAVPIITYESNGIFYKCNGEILYKNNKYYWHDYDEEPYPLTIAHKKHPYPLKKEYYKELDLIFSYMYK